LRQLANQPDGATPAVLRTAAGAVDLLDDLCRTKLKPEMYASAPLRFLAVDDDPISLRVISRALRRTLKQPDLAEDATAALALADRQGYDVIFLDVQMPVMDGFDLCAKIHQTAPNRTTPIVFITCQSSLNARARSSLCGGLDLIGKPFLSFEVTLKALIFALRHRLETLALVEA
jgi:two-component system sensor histidine kinase BarA